MTKIVQQPTNRLETNFDTVIGGQGKDETRVPEIGYGGNYAGSTSPSGLTGVMTRKKIEKFLKDFGGVVMADTSTPTFGGGGEKKIKKNISEITAEANPHIPKSKLQEKVLGDIKYFLEKLDKQLIEERVLVRPKTGKPFYRRQKVKPETLGYKPARQSVTDSIKDTNSKLDFIQTNARRFNQLAPTQKEEFINTINQTSNQLRLIGKRMHSEIKESKTKEGVTFYTHQSPENPISRARRHLVKISEAIKANKPLLVNSYLDDFGRDYREAINKFQEQSKQKIVKSINGVLEKSLDNSKSDIISKINIITKQNNLFNKQEKIYFQPEKGEKAPEGSQVIRGKRGGTYYSSRQKGIEEFKALPKDRLGLFSILNREQFESSWQKQLKFSNNFRNMLEFLQNYIDIANPEIKVSNEYIQMVKNKLLERLIPYLQKARDIYVNRKIEEIAQELEKADYRIDQVIAIDKLVSLVHRHTRTILPQIFGINRALIPIEDKIILPVLNYLASGEESKMEKSFIEIRKANRLNINKSLDKSDIINNINSITKQNDLLPLQSQINNFLQKSEDNSTIYKFLEGYKQLAILGPELSNTKLDTIYNLSTQVNIIKSYGIELKNTDRLEEVISIDKIAHQLHQEKCYPILDELAGISKDLGEFNREDRLLILKGADIIELEKLSNLEVLRKSIGLEQGKSFWNLMVKAIKQGVKALSNNELVLLREWCYARI